jgi:hypothetical protein
MKEGHCPLDCVTMSDLCGRKYRFLLLTDSHYSTVRYGTGSQWFGKTNTQKAKLYSVRN